MKWFLDLTWTDRLYILLIGLMTIGMFAYSVSHGADFHVFYVAGQRALAHESLYQTADGWMPFKYHPLWALFFSVWTFLPEKIALTIFNLLHLAAWWTVAKIWADRIGWDLKSWKNRFLLILFAFSALSAEFGFGQINGFIFLAIMLIFSNLERENPRPLVAGFWLAIIMSVKLNFGLLLFYCLWRNWRSAFGVALCFLIFHVVVGFYFGSFGYDIYQDWIVMLLGQSSSQFTIFEAQGFLRLFMHISELYGKYLWALLMAIFIGFGYILERREPRDSNVKLIYWLTGVFLFSPLAWWYQILFLYPLVFFLLRSNISRTEKNMSWVCLGIFAFVTYNTLGSEGIMVFKNMMGFFTVAIILCFIFLRRFGNLPAVKS